MIEPRLDPKLNKHDKVYHQLTYDILTSPRLNFRDAERTVVDTIGVFGPQVEYDIRDGTIPLSATKPIGYQSQLFPEIVGFLRNENNLKWYLEQGMKIWTPNAFNFYRKNLSNNNQNAAWKDLIKDSPEFNAALQDYEELVRSGKDPQAGHLGNFYPKQWRSFEGVLNGEAVVVDQLEDMIHKLKTQPTGRYAIVTAWNPIDIRNGQAALAPCHNLFQAYRWTDRQTGKEHLDLKMYQRSADHLLGVAFNAPQYSTILSYIASAIDVEPGFFTHTFGDIHIYVGQGERANWYRQEKNLNWLQDRIVTKDPNEVLEELLFKLPSEGDNPGYDHMPYMIKQLGRQSKHDPPKLEVNYKPLDQIEVSDLKVTGYKIADRAEKLTINGNREKMAS